MNADQSNITSVGTLSSLIVGTDITPNVDVTYDLGNATHRFKDLWLSGQTIQMDNATIEVLNDTIVLTNPAGGKFIVDGSSTRYSSVAVTVSASAQPNITSVGTLANLTVDGGDLTIANANVHISTAGKGLFVDNLYYANGVAWDMQQPAGSNTQIQFNDSGVFGATGALTFDKTSNTLAVSNAVQTQYVTGPNGSRNLTFNYNSVGGAVGVSADLNVGVSGSGGNVVSNGYFVGNGYYVTSVNAALLNGNSASDLRTYTDNKTANAYSNAMADTLSRNGTYTGNNTFSGANLVISGTNTYISSNLTLAGANLSISSNVLLTGSSLTGTSTDLSIRNATISGNLTVTGTVTTINVATIVVND